MNSSLRRIQVSAVNSTRYDGVASSISGGGERPQSWDERVAGIDTITTDSGEVIKLNSSAMQSPPKSGWVLMLTGGDSTSGFSWTLYGMARERS
jgi:hypothetical protein